MKTFAAIYINNEIREKSSSGGVFSALASKFDVVYGVAMTENCYGAEMIRVEGDISSLRGSKYFQAKMGDAFKLVRKDVEEGRKVLFSGTGCQINGLSKFLGKEYPNLFLLDIICHGTPSPKLWKEYAEYQESKYGKLKSVNFRCKEDSWSDFGMKENQLYISKNKDPFMRMFLSNFCLRPSCYECHAKNFKCADMTIADFWGIENVAPEMDDGRGTSLVIARTEKGLALFSSVSDNLKWKEVCYEDAIKGNPSEHFSVARPTQRNVFFKDLSEMSFEEMKKKYAADVSFPRKIVRKLKRVIKRIGGGQRLNAKKVYGVLYTFQR